MVSLLFSFVVLLVLCGVVFVTSPAGLLDKLTPDRMNGTFWAVVILAYYLYPNGKGGLAAGSDRFPHHRRRCRAGAAHGQPDRVGPKKQAVSWLSLKVILPSS